MTETSGDDRNSPDAAIDVQPDIDIEPGEERLEAWRARTGGLLTVVAVGSLPILALELIREDLPSADNLLIDIVNIVVLVVFAVDYLVGLTLTTRKGHYVLHNKLELMLVISQALVLVPSLAALGITRAVRLARLMRVLSAVARILAIGGIASRQGRQALRERAFAFALGTAGMTWLCSAVGFTLAEDVGIGGRIDSFYDGLWWSLATITTVGYGDIAPVTAAGRVIGALTMLVGISAFAIVTARIAEFFVDVDGDRDSDD